MIHKKVTQVGNKIIRTRARRVVDVHSKKVKRTIQDLIDSMRHHNLVGMAAPQIGESTRIFVTEVRPTKFRKKDDITRDPVRVFINPRITSSSSRKVSDWEGCGSVAHGDLFAQLTRPNNVTVSALNQEGKEVTLHATGLLARIIQHELDHLNGILFVDNAIPKTYMSGDEYRYAKKTSKLKA